MKGKAAAQSARREAARLEGAAQELRDRLEAQAAAHLQEMAALRAQLDQAQSHMLARAAAEAARTYETRFASDSEARVEAALRAQAESHLDALLILLNRGTLALTANAPGASVQESIKALVSSVGLPGKVDYARLRIRRFAGYSDNRAMRRLRLRQIDDLNAKAFYGPPDLTR